eukprot:CAMPEP_0203685038 /NCGR_PEP_ID=MMETSP0090-20130426/48339_1 /ASSEMBLY_ACC=CAM_ASM_001088 /TAXON_ID=426623 /ORGANISM="Chaetoceros affinis, Strain CCMP159" /LENGTH=900 /DNA_ID=CAMNT_0050554221 /DNA_START=1 /DNA_END=2703 /DNA_ORIENTATION=-
MQCHTMKYHYLLPLVLSSTTYKKTSGTGSMDDGFNPFDPDESTPLRESMRDRYVGETFNLLSLTWMHKYMTYKVQGFEKLTGVDVQMNVNSTQATWFSDVDEDIEGPGFIHLYSSFGNWLPTFVEKGGLKDLTEDVRNQVGLDWFDIMPAIRGIATYDEKVYAIPVDGDAIIMLYRKDLVEDVGLPTPKSWDDVLEITEYYADKDFNGDGIPDFANCFSTRSQDIGGTMFWSIASSFLQTKGTAQGAFFNPETFQPKSTEPIFEDILELYNKLVQQSPFRDKGEYGWQDNLAEFQAGRCVLWYNYPGPTKTIVSNQQKNGMIGKLVYATLPGMKCKDNIQCPNISPDGNNHAPFLAGGGMTFSVSNRATNKQQRMALDFAFYVSDPDVSYRDVAYPDSYLDPLRQRHTAALSNVNSRESQAFLAFNWTEEQLGMIKEVTEFNFLHKNYVIDLSILGAFEYQESATMPHLIKMWSGEWNTQQTAQAITDSWNAVTETYGLREQRAIYRKTLGLPEYIEEPNLHLPIGIIVPVVTISAVLFILLSAIVYKQRLTIKYRTRDVQNAPKNGTVAMLFTDIEGSTELWDSSKKLMTQALEIHHSVIRGVIQKYDAYEVKTIGDAFMIAVGNADAAVLIANDIQEQLLHADWPLELASMPASCVEYYSRHIDEKAQKTFSGLRVRIGINIGEHSEEIEEGGQVQIKYDKVAKGYDYYGPAINLAARIEDLGFGGQTLISSNVHDQLTDAVKLTTKISIIGELAIRGCAEPTLIYQVMPSSLKDRRFQGTVRRRDSQDITMIESSLMSCEESVNNLDLDTDVFKLTPIQLQNTVIRLRKRLKDLIMQQARPEQLDDEDLSLGSFDSEQSEEINIQDKKSKNSEKERKGIVVEKNETVSLLNKDKNAE